MVVILVFSCFVVAVMATALNMNMSLYVFGTEVFLKPFLPVPLHDMLLRVIETMNTLSHHATAMIGRISQNDTLTKCPSVLARKPADPYPEANGRLLQIEIRDSRGLSEIPCKTINRRGAET